MGGGTKEFDIATTGKKLVIQELENMSDPQTGRILTGSWVWDSSVLLSEWITNQQQNEFDLQGKTVLELGAGMGIPGMTAALLGASHVVLTDVKSLITGLRNNVDINSLGDRVKVGELVWGSEESWSSLVGNIPELAHRIDLVLMSDVFYDITSMPELGRTLKWIVKSNEAQVWCATEIRTWTSQCLYELMKEGFNVTNSLNSPSLISSSSLMSDDDPDENQPSFAVFQIVPRII
ncbi:hypothetical protein MKW94_016120 [Papaver nudicaule]|uniref:Uncharacterized protein n=1 Tax=Papaver nudicaule TaxID=74823 RepID=A0AA41VGB3_PAPNU|nr:hypothetical protein [Papaver nudicaule]